MNSLRDAELFLKMGDVERALTVYYDITNTSPSNVAAWIGLTEIIITTGNCLEKHINNRFSEQNCMKLTCSVHIVVDELLRCFSALKALGRGDNEISNYIDTFLLNITSGKIFINVGNIYNIEKNFPKVFSKEKTEQIIAQGKQNAECVNFCRIDNFGDDRGRKTCVFYYGSIMHYKTEGYDDFFDHCEKANNVADQRKLSLMKTSLMEKRRSKNVCQHCGGNFKGLFNKRCCNCNTKKDY